MVIIRRMTQEYNMISQWWGMIFILLSLVILYCSNFVLAETPTPESLNFFENKIRPLLMDHCLKCHGAKKSESGLRLDNIASILKGGDSGPGLIRGDADKSLIINAIRHEGDYEMPPDKKLEARKIAVLTKWVNNGAFWPEGVKLGEQKTGLRGGPITEAERKFWSFQPVKNSRPLENPDDFWSKNDIDRFIITMLNEKGLSSRGSASKWTLIRRATYDLTGLPPTPDEINAFLEDNSSNAFSNVVNRLLESKSYGERWGRHWLDVVRYADTAGETADYPTPLSWKYRNWVISAFNSDKPYDEFIREQIAGDIIAKQDSKISRKKYRDLHIATGFIAISRRFGFDSENYHNLTIQDTIDTVGQSVVGLTLGCARCHDHKFDPVNKKDYYSLYGIFESTKYSFPGSEEKKRPYDLIPVLPPEESQKRKAEYDTLLASLETEIKTLKKTQASEQKKVSGKIQKSVKKQKSDNGQKPDIATKPDVKSNRLKELIQKRDDLKKSGPYEMIYGAVEKEHPKNAKIQIRGDQKKLGDEVPRRNLEIFGGELVPDNSGSGRLQLARWLTDPKNSLTARVMVNRIWQYHFGQGIVSTENDFGTRGRRPTHPELLDWLAKQFQNKGWSIKAMHRLIMNSATYQQSNDFDENANELDPTVKLLWRFPRRRLSAEEIRDSMLMISGDLDQTIGSAHPFPDTDKWNFTQHSPFYGLYETKQRSVYLMQQRLKTHPFLSLFDGADPNVSTPKRILTTVPTQTLFLMNDPFVHERSLSFAKRLTQKLKNNTDRVRYAWLSTLAREPAENEISTGVKFISDYQEKLETENIPMEKQGQAALACLIRTLFIRNEFLFVD